VDGTYVLTVREKYGPPASGVVFFRTLRFSAGFVEEARQDNPIRSKWSLKTTGSTITFTAVCSTDNSLSGENTVKYTATPSTFVQFQEVKDGSGTTVSTFARQ